MSIRDLGLVLILLVLSVLWSLQSMEPQPVPAKRQQFVLARAALKERLRVKKLNHAKALRSGGFARVSFSFNASKKKDGAL